MKRFATVIPFLFLAWGMFFTFRYFWNGLDRLSGDTGDARFNAVVLEHTWLWLNGIHASLFNFPIYFPHPNVYAYSDFLLGTAPLYWFPRALGLESLLAFQVWLLASVILNFGIFYGFSRKQFQLPIFWASLAAYFFTFAMPRIVQLGHAQLTPEFYIVVAAGGAMSWWKNPKSTLAPFLFLLGTALQLLTSFYFFWFWIWTLSIYIVYVLISRPRRVSALEWIQKINRGPTLIAAILSAILALPFISHYLLTARELGMRGWVTITDGLPRIYSWFALPPDHWEWKFTPFSNAIKQLPPSIWGEHYLSLGLVTWVISFSALYYSFKKRNDRYLSVPGLTMFILSFCIGRLSLWIFMSYLFPGAGAIRVVSRIQVYMLLFWAILFTTHLRDQWNQNSKNLRMRLLIICGLLAFIAENTYTGTLTHLSFSRSEENARIEKITQRIPSNCEVLYYIGLAKKSDDFYQLEAMRAASLKGIATINGYSGNQPKPYASIFQNPALDAAKKLAAWEAIHPELEHAKICQVDFVD